MKQKIREVAQGTGGALILSLIPVWLIFIWSDNIISNKILWTNLSLIAICWLIDKFLEE